MFNSIHIIAIFSCLAVIVVGTVFSMKLSFEKVTRILLVIGIVSEFVKVMTYTLMNEDKLGGYLPKTDLPFHLCSLQILFLVVLVLSENEKVKRVLRSFMLPTCLIGGLAAIMIPTSSSVSRLNPITFQYFIYHAAIMIFALRMLAGKDVHFTVKDYGSCLLMLLATMFVAMYLNSMLYNGTADAGFLYEVTDGSHIGKVQLTNVNFMYTVNPPAEGLPFLNKNHGWLVYFVHYLFLCLVGITLVYIRPIAVALKKKS